MKLQENTPFTIEAAFSQVWTGGQPDSGSGINVHITIQNPNNKEIELQHFYFRGKKTTLEDNTKRTKGLYIARFIKLAEKEIILHNDPKKEAQNEPPKLQAKFPFTLKDNEGVLSYEENGTLKYVKLKNIEEKLPNYYPSAPQNKQ
ncbi:hypothetical protein [Kordia sp. SMS9]|uniref:hypothetical protein n=1 Tax=Kordia sp. SMS9 TaxID=2282170 RepID=UPI000E0D9607|nr:hypothetical protein [Kordia sp. SMS9]